jgi:hypothetical protein
MKPRLYKHANAIPDRVSHAWRPFGILAVGIESLSDVTHLTQYYKFTVPWRSK